MVAPLIVQPDYTNAMVKGLSTSLAYTAESKKGMKVSRGGGGGGDSKQTKAMKARKEGGKIRGSARPKKDKAEGQAARNQMALETAVKKADTERTKADTAAKKETFNKAKSYAPAVTQDNYDDYLAYLGENGIKMPGVASPKEVLTMKSDEFKQYMGGFFGKGKAQAKQPSRGTQIKDDALQAWNDGKKLTDQQKRIVDKVYPTSTEKDLTPSQKVKLEQSLVKTEMAITNPENAQDEMSVPLIRFFNTHSKQPYMYGFQDDGEENAAFESLNPFSSKFYGVDKETTGVTKIDLPVISGKQLTSADVMYTVEKSGKSVKEILTDLGVYNAN